MILNVSLKYKTCTWNRKITGFRTFKIIVPEVEFRKRFPFFFFILVNRSIKELREVIRNECYDYVIWCLRFLLNLWSKRTFFYTNELFLLIYLVFWLGFSLFWWIKLLNILMASDQIRFYGSNWLLFTYVHFLLLRSGNWFSEILQSVILRIISIMYLKIQFTQHIKKKKKNTFYCNFFSIFQLSCHATVMLPWNIIKNRLF